jgi:hypothetical protein
MSADQVRQNCTAGTTEQARESIERWSIADAKRLHLRPVDHNDVEHLEIIASILR